MWSEHTQMQITKAGNVGINIECDISNLSDDDYNTINQLYLDHLLITFTNQEFKSVPFAKLIRKMGSFANHKQMLWIKNGDNKGRRQFQDPFEYNGADEEYLVQRVTGEKTKKGIATGIFGNGELDWHSNMNGDMDRARGVALQGSWHCEGTHTAFMDTVKAYADLPDDIKERCEGVIGQYEYAPEKWAKGVPAPQLNMMIGMGLVDRKYTMPLVNEGFNGKKGLYFHFHNNCNFPTDPELKDILMQHCFQDKYCYSHEWHEGDIVISDQVLTLHKRVEWDPEIIAKRVLHRITFHYDNMIPDYFAKYTKIKETDLLEY